MQVTPSRLSSSLPSTFLLASSPYPALDLPSFSYSKCRLSLPLLPSFLPVNFLKLFLYFLELVLRAPFKPRPFPPRETFFVFCEETSSEVCESRPTGLNFKYYIFRPRRAYLSVSWLGRVTVKLRKTLTLCARLLVRCWLQVKV